MYAWEGIGAQGTRTLQGFSRMGRSEVGGNQGELRESVCRCF